MSSLDAELALQIEEALSLAQDALAGSYEVEEVEEAEVEFEEISPEEEEIDEIANMLMEKPPTPPPAMPVPPSEDPPASVVSLILGEDAVDDDMAQSQPPLPPDSPPPVTDADFGETLMKETTEEIEQIVTSVFEPDEDAQLLSPSLLPSLPDEDFGEILMKKTAEEMERFKNLIFGVNEKIAVTESCTEETENVAAALKKEIEESLQEREAMVKKIESEFNSEKELLVGQMEIAADELKAVMDQSTQNITDAKSKATRAEKELVTRIFSFKVTIDEVAAGTIEINKDKERIQESKQSMLDKVVQEGKKKLEQFKKSFDFDVNYAKQINEDLARRTEEAESKVRGVYDQITQMRTERESLQQQIVDVEKNALEEIETLQREQKSDDERYAIALQKERERMEDVVESAYQAYAIKVCKKIVERQAVEADYQDKVRVKTMQITAAKDKQAARVKEYLDKLEEKHKKERIVIYQEKFEALAAVRKKMNEDIDVEYDKIDETHKTMKAKIEEVKERTAQLKSDFLKELVTKRNLGKEEEAELLGQIEDVKVDMTDKMKTQRRLYEEQKKAYLEGVNAEIADSEEEIRQKWRALAGIKKSYSEVSADRDNMIDNVAEKNALIGEYESDRTSFRKSLRLTARVAREKIGLKTRRLLKRDKKNTP
mmetsp:Transcript_17354/g.32529  ORF Transcript_17354/g.32529 Transcript_17354/m.32529 type:complete len:658 (+) Transcript_17354:2-1975(+)